MTEMKITLEIDDQFFSAVSGAAGAQFMLAAIANDPLFFYNAADMVRVQGVFGVASEDR